MMRSSQISILLLAVTLLVLATITKGLLYYLTSCNAPIGGSNAHAPQQHLVRAVHLTPANQIKPVSIPLKPHSTIRSIIQHPAVDYLAWPTHPHYTVDKDVETYVRSLSTSNPYVRYELHNTSYIEGATLTLSPICCMERMSYYEVWVGINATAPDADGNVRCYKHGSMDQFYADDAIANSVLTADSDDPYTIHSHCVASASTTEARYVYVYLPGHQQTLMYAEFDITARPLDQQSAKKQHVRPLPAAAHQDFRPTHQHAPLDFEASSSTVYHIAIVICGKERFSDIIRLLTSIFAVMSSNDYASYIPHLQQLSAGTSSPILSSDAPTFQIHLIVDQDASSIQEELSSFMVGSGISIVFHSKLESRPDLFRPCAMQKLWIASVLPDTVSDVLIIDSDAVILSSLAPVFEWWQLHKQLAVEAGKMPPHIGFTREAASTTEYGWYAEPGHGSYVGPSGVNTGVMMMDLDAIRRQQIEDQWLEVATTPNATFILGDQDVLNQYYNATTIPDTLYQPYALMPCNFNYRFNPDDQQCFIKPALIMHCNNLNFYGQHQYHPCSIARLYYDTLRDLYLGYDRR